MLLPRTNPPRPHCAFRVAAIGHRWDRLPPRHADAVRERLRGVLDAVATLVTSLGRAPDSGFPAAPAELTLYSGLADGTDRIAAETALADARWRLHAVAPFDVAHYERDFVSRTSLPGSVEHFRALWRAAGARTILDGMPGEFDAYVPLARVLVDFADLLVVVWDGERGRGPGGTATSVTRARSQEMAIVRIDARDPSRCWLENLDRADHGRAEGLVRLDARVRALLAPPPHVLTHGSAEPLDLRADYFAETLRRRAMPQVFDRVVAAVQARTSDKQPSTTSDRLASRHVPTATNSDDPVTATIAAWQPRWASMPDPIRDQAFARFAEHHAWADRLASEYGALFRQAFTWVFLLAWTAVLAAYLAVVHFDLSFAGLSALSVVEIAVLVTINRLVLRGRRRRLHERWLDYRSLAEHLRHLATLWPMARSTPLIRVPQAPLRGDPRESWIGWMLRSIAREAGLIPVTLDEAHASACRRLLCDAELEPQRAFHAATMTRAAQVHHALTVLAERLFAVALAVAGLHLVIGVAAHYWEPIEFPGRLAELILAGCGVAFPAIAASIHGFLGTGDFAGVAIRSAGIEPHLAQIEGQLTRLDPLDTSSVGELAVEATNLMERELATWRTVAQTRELERP